MVSVNGGSNWRGPAVERRARDPGGVPRMLRALEKSLADVEIVPGVVHTGTCSGRAFSLDLAPQRMGDAETFRRPESLNPESDERDTQTQRVAARKEQVSPGRKRKAEKRMAGMSQLSRERLESKDALLSF